MREISDTMWASLYDKSRSYFIKHRGAVKGYSPDDLAQEVLLRMHKLNQKGELDGVRNIYAAAMKVGRDLRIDKARQDERRASSSVSDLSFVEERGYDPSRRGLNVIVDLMGSSLSDVLSDPQYAVIEAMRDDSENIAQVARYTGYARKDVRDMFPRIGRSLARSMGERVVRLVTLNAERQLDVLPVERLEDLARGMGYKTWIDRRVSGSTEVGGVLRRDMSTLQLFEYYSGSRDVYEVSRLADVLTDLQWAILVKHPTVSKRVVDMLDISKMALRRAHGVVAERLAKIYCAHDLN